MAETNFHFLVNALPDVASLAADEIDEVRYLIESNLDHESLRTFRFLLYRNDNKNLLKLMRKRDGILPKMADRFNTPAVFSFEDLDDMLIDAYEDEAEIPGYLAEFLQEERQSNWAVRERENRLVDLYYEAGTCYPQDFISAMFLFKRDLKNILLALNARMQGFKVARITVGDYDLPAALASSPQADFGLAGVYEYIPQMAAYLNEGRLVELEHLLDDLLLDHCATLVGDSIFTLNYVLYYFLELSLRHRWHELTPEKGARALSETVQEIIRTAGQPSKAEMN
ncbi:MAG TPA: DUF2764 family protein [Turneriella sp.]|nr:DUF2764 family protein [Turneriella sp.]